VESKGSTISIYSKADIVFLIISGVTWKLLLREGEEVRGNFSDNAQFWTSTILKWLKLWDYKLSHRDPLQWHHLLTKCHSSLPTGSKVIRSDTDCQTDDFKSLLSFLESRLKRVNVCVATHINIDIWTYRIANSRYITYADSPYTSIFLDWYIYKSIDTYWHISI
jgi:hypothetical protein